jgi:glycosyltransferase 2 family protein
LTLSNRLKMAFLGVIVSLVAFYFIASQMRWDSFWQAWTTANYWYVVPCIGLLLLGLITRALRWRLLLDNGLSLSHAFSIMNVAYLVNGLLPLRIGELARVYLVWHSKKHIPIPTTSSTIIVERLLDLLAVVVMVLLALILGQVPDAIKAASAVAAVSAIAGFLFLIFLASRRDWATNIFHILIEKLGILRRVPILATWFEQFLDGLKPLTNARQVLLAFFWTALSWAVSTAAGYVLMFAFFEQGSLAATMLYIAAAAFAIALPAVPGNLGTYEASILLALGAMGYEQSNAAIAFAVMVHAVNILVHVGTGILGFLHEGISLNQLSQGVQEMQQSTG